MAKPKHPAGPPMTLLWHSQLVHVAVVCVPILVSGCAETDLLSPVAPGKYDFLDCPSITKLLARALYEEANLAGLMTRAICTPSWRMWKRFNFIVIASFVLLVGLFLFAQFRLIPPSVSSQNTSPTPYPYSPQDPQSTAVSPQNPQSTDVSGQAPRRCLVGRSLSVNEREFCCTKYNVCRH